MVKPHSSNFRVITTNVLGVRKLRIITVSENWHVEKMQMVLSVAAILHNPVLLILWLPVGICKKWTILINAASGGAVYMSWKWSFCDLKLVLMAFGKKRGDRQSWQSGAEPKCYKIYISLQLQSFTMFYIYNWFKLFSYFSTISTLVIIFLPYAQNFSHKVPYKT